jgi:hypothetical protein
VKMLETVNATVIVAVGRRSRRFKVPFGRIEALPGREERGQLIVPLRFRLAWWIPPALRLLGIAHALRLCHVHVEAPRA